MQELATINFVDAESNDQAVAIVRAGPNLVGLCLSLEHNGDIEVFLSSEACEQLIDALKEAIAAASIRD